MSALYSPLPDPDDGSCSSLPNPNLDDREAREARRNKACTRSSPTTNPLVQEASLERSAPPSPTTNPLPALPLERSAPPSPMTNPLPTSPLKRSTPPSSTTNPIQPTTSPDDNDDDEVSSQNARSKSTQDACVSSSDGLNRWVQLTQDSEAHGDKSKTIRPSSQEKSSEGEDPSDWFTVDDFDFDKVETV